MSKCTRCEELLKGEELESPCHDDDDGKILCDRCYRERYMFTCYVCENDGHVSQQGRGHLLIANDAEECGMSRGIYKIKECPYYTHNYFNMWFHPEALELTTIQVPALGEKWYPSGHVCAECESKLTKRKE